MVTKASAGDPSLRTLSRGVAEASEPQIRRIVATVDTMAARGAADDLIAPLRHRLAGLRPARPLRFARLLFFPLDPVIVRAARWRPNHCTVPRTAIAPMARLVEQALGTKVSAIKSAIHNLKAESGDLVTALGASLWPEAGAILPRAKVPAAWKDTGLGDQAYHSLARRIGAVLHGAPALDAICAETAQGKLPPDSAAIKAMVGTVAGLAPDALPMLAALLMTRLPQAAHLLYEIDSGSAAAAIKAATQQAADLLLDQFQIGEGADAAVAISPLAEAGATVGRIAALLNELNRDDATPERRTQLRALRQKLDTDCKARFEAGLNTELLAAMRTLPDQPEAADIKGLETMARNLRMLESEGRTLGSGAIYDRLLAQAADTVQAQPGSSGMTPADRLRLVEILAGSEAAMALLDRR